MGREQKQDHSPSVINLPQKITYFFHIASCTIWNPNLQGLGVGGCSCRARDL